MRSSSQVDAHRQLGAHRPDIEQRAAQGEFSGTVHFGGGAIARRDQALAEGAELEARTALEREAARTDVVDRWQPREQAVDAEQQHAALQRRQSRQCRQALRDDVRVRRKLVVGQDLPVGEREDLEAGTAEEAQLRRQPVEFTRIRGQAHP